MAEVLRLAVTPTKRKAVAAAGLASLIGGAAAAKYLWPVPPPRAADPEPALTARAAEPDPPAPLPPPATPDPTTPAAAGPLPAVPVVEVTLPGPDPTAPPARQPDPRPLPPVAVEPPTPAAPPAGDLPPPTGITMPTLTTPAADLPAPVVTADARSVLPVPEVVRASNPPEPVGPPKPTGPTTPSTTPSPVTIEVPTLTTPPAAATPPALPGLTVPAVTPAAPPAIDAPKIDIDPVPVKPADGPKPTGLTPVEAPKPVTTGDDFKATGSPPTPAATSPPPAVVIDLPKSAAPPAALPVARPAAEPSAPPVRPAANAEAVTDFDVDLHEVKPGDTYTGISQKYLGDDRYAEAIRAFNGNAALTQPRKVQVPPIHVLRKRYPAQIGRPAAADRPAEWSTAPRGTLASGTREGAESGGYRTYTVPPGGITLKGVAKAAFGDELEWRKVWDLNPKFSPQEAIPEGTRLLLPAGAKIDR